MFGALVAGQSYFGQPVVDLRITQELIVTGIDSDVVFGTHTVYRRINIQLPTWAMLLTSGQSNAVIPAPSSTNVSIGSDQTVAATPDSGQNAAIVESDRAVAVLFDSGKTTTLIL